MSTLQNVSSNSSRIGMGEHVVFENDHLFELDVLLQSLGYEVSYTHIGQVRKMKGFYNPNTGESLTLGEGRD